MAKGFKHGAGGGASLNFKVIGNPQPKNPKENTIWVNTDVSVTGWIFSATEPENLAEGMVWISTSKSSPTAFNALKKNGIQVYPISAKQYVNGAWVDKTAKIYQNGAWVDLILPIVLHENGDGCEDVTGGWQNLGKSYTGGNSGGSTGGKALIVTNITGGIKLSQSAGGKGGLYVTTNKIPLDNYRSLCFTGSIYREEYYQNNIGIEVLSAIGSNTEDNAVVKYLAPIGTNVYDDEALLDITDLKGSYHIAFYINSSDDKYIEVKKLELK